MIDFESKVAVIDVRYLIGEVRIRIVERKKENCGKKLFLKIVNKLNFNIDIRP